MKDQFLELFKAGGELPLKIVVLNISMAAVLGFIIYVSYFIAHQGTIYSRKFNVSLVILTILTATVMTVIGNNIALSLGLVGALSIVRFRTAVKDSKDTVYIFWAIIAGICCGIGDFTVALGGSTIAFAAIFILGTIKRDDRILIIIRGAKNRQAAVSGFIFKIFKGKAVLRVKNSGEENIELIYEVSSSLLKKTENDVNIIDSIYQLGSIEYVNIVTQDSEISG